MDPLHYAGLVIALLIVFFAAVVFVWRALYRLWKRAKDEQDAAEAFAAFEDQERRMMEEFRRHKEDR